MLTDKLSQHTNIVTLVLEEIESIHASESQLQEVVVQALFRDSDQTRRILQRVPHGLTVAELDSVVELAPERDTLDNEANLALLGPL